MNTNNKLTFTKETSLDQCNKLKQWIDTNKDFLDELDIIQFADYIIIKPKGEDIKQFIKYWKIHQKYQEYNTTELSDGEQEK